MFARMLRNIATYGFQVADHNAPGDPPAPGGYTATGCVLASPSWSVGGFSYPATLRRSPTITASTRRTMPRSRCPRCWARRRTRFRPPATATSSRPLPTGRTHRANRCSRDRFSCALNKLISTGPGLGIPVPAGAQAAAAWLAEQVPMHWSGAPANVCVSVLDAESLKGDPARLSAWPPRSPSAAARASSPTGARHNPSAAWRARRRSTAGWRSC